MKSIFVVVAIVLGIVLLTDLTLGEGDKKHPHGEPPSSIGLGPGFLGSDRPLKRQVRQATNDGNKTSNEISKKVNTVLNNSNATNMPAPSGVNESIKKVQQAGEKLKQGLAAGRSS